MDHKPDHLIMRIKETQERIMELIKEMKEIQLRNYERLNQSLAIQKRSMAKILSSLSGTEILMFLIDIKKLIKREFSTGREICWM